ncbi:hypothetical protein Tco_1485736, partial [Tanacetum coccineum]
LRSGYHQLRVREEDIPIKTAFRTRPYLIMFVIVFIDDILIYPKSKEEHEGHLKLIPELLEKEKLFGKFLKCEFWLQEVRCLGHVVNSEGIHVDPSKTEAVKNWKPPKTLTDIRKANVVADALSRKEWMKPRRAQAMSMTIHSSIKDGILKAQSEASKVINTPAERLRGFEKQLERKEDNGLKLGYSSTLSRIFIQQRLPPEHQLCSFQSIIWKEVSPRKGVKCLSDVNLHIPLEEVKINDKLHFVEEPMEIMDSEVKKLKKRQISIVKVRWNSRRGPESTWEREDEMKRNFEVKDNEEEGSDLRVQTPSHYESIDDEESDEVTHGANVEGEELDEEETNEEDEVNELYSDVNVNLEGRDTVNNRVLLCHLASFLTCSTPIQIQQTNQFAAAVSLILDIVDAYLANKMHKVVKTAVQLQSDKLRDEAQAENADFINKLDENIKKIIKDQVKEQVKAQVSKILSKIEKTVYEQLEAEVLTRSSNESKTSHAIAANLSELELKKILIDKMENTVSFKRRRDNEDKDEESSARSNRGSKRRRAGKEPESTSAPKEKTSKTTGKSTKRSKSHHNSVSESAQAEKPMHTAKDLEEPAHQEFKTGVTEDQPDE